MKKESINAKRNNKLYCDSFQLKGNSKLLDYCDSETGISYKYAQYNTIAGFCCPYASIGCAIACYAKSGLHVLPSVKECREKSYKASLDVKFSDKMIYTIEVELTSKRYNGNVMIIRIHESGDFYSLEYLKKWVKIFENFLDNESVIFCFYTKSFEYFLQLNDHEKSVINSGLERGRIAMSLSIDDTTSPEQIARAMKIKKLFPLVNIYYCTSQIEKIQFDNECKCENCAKCGHCTHASGKTTAVRIHSVTEKQLEKYNKFKRNAKKCLD